MMALLATTTNHYRCWRTFVIATSSCGATDKLERFPAPLVLPGASPVKLLLASLSSDVTAAALDRVAKHQAAASTSTTPVAQLAATATSALHAIATLYGPLTPLPQQRTLSHSKGRRRRCHPNAPHI